MNKKKVLVFHHSGAIGGGGVSMLHILRSIEKEKYQVKVYCPYENGDMHNAISDLGIEVEGTFDKNWVYPHYNGRTYFALDPRFVKAVRYIKSSQATIINILKEEKPDILLLNSMTLFWIGYIAKELNIKTVCFYRETLPEKTRMRNKLICESLSNDIDKLCFISQFDTDFVGATDKSHIIYDRIEVENFVEQSKEDARNQLNLDVAENYILFMGGMWDVKGTDVIVKALKDVDAKLIIMQYVPQKKELIKLSDVKGIKNKFRYIFGMDYEAKVINFIDKNNLWDKIIFMKAQQNVTPWLYASDVVVFPSKAPHQSRPLYEAGIAKRPVVISNFENTAEFAKDKVNVLTFQSGDYKDLAKKINSLLIDDVLASKLVKNNYKQSINQHNLDTLSKDMRDVLDNL